MTSTDVRRTGGLFVPQRRAVPLGTWLKMAAAEPVEIMAWAGFDFVVIDLEHAPLTLESTYRLINSSAALGMTPLVRVPDGNAALIQKILDAGARGILVPHVDSAAEADEVGRACRFPPLGVRGSGTTSRAGLWGTLPSEQYLAAGNTDVLCIPQLESEQAVRAADEILALDVVDAVFIGAADLALSMGVPASDAAVTSLVAHGLGAARAAGKPCGLAFGARPELAAAAAASGAGFLALSNDLSMLAASARGLIDEVGRAGDAASSLIATTPQDE